MTFSRRFGTKVTSHAMTIRDPEQVDKSFDDVYAAYGKLDILVNNAGGQFAQPAMDISPKGWRAVVDINLNGTFHMMQAAARRWRETGGPGYIVDIVAVVWRGLPQVSHTCAARAGQIYLSKTVATEWAPYKIRVNCVAPGTIATDAFNYNSSQCQASLYQANPMKRAGDAQDIAESIL
ncbi:SDR family oxidoreductase [Mameliella alba]|uniref:Peroxisomal trans-2-enoyl-CoA reductase n=1 Tax=Mameliella alba TaxID=561184 RepID=A0A0B3RYI5_9RHOB|nr:SDR family oxidoreductase [Mameliella alba]KHQ51803.1 putative oxidoreductase [Mameliella alba]